MDAVTTKGLEESVNVAVQKSLWTLGLDVAGRLQEVGMLGSPEVSELVSAEIRRCLAEAADDPAAYSVDTGWFTQRLALNV